MSRYSTAVLDALPLAGAEWLARRDGEACSHPWHGCSAVIVYRAEQPEPPAETCPGCGADRPTRWFRMVVVGSKYDVTE